MQWNASQKPIKFDCTLIISLHIELFYHNVYRIKDASQKGLMDAQQAICCIIEILLCCWLILQKKLGTGRRQACKSQRVKVMRVTRTK